MAVLLPGQAGLCRWGTGQQRWAHLEFPEGPSGQPPLQTLTVRLRCEGLWVRKQRHLRWTQCLEKKEESTLCFHRDSHSQALAELPGCHQSWGHSAGTESFVPWVLPCGRGHSSLSCAQDQLLTLELPLSPGRAVCSQARPSSHAGASTCPWQPGCEAQPCHQSVPLSWAQNKASPLGAPAACTCARPGGTAVQEQLSLGTKEGVPVHWDPSHRQAYACSSPSLSCCPGQVSHECCGSWQPRGHVFPVSHPPAPAEPVGTESPTAKFLRGTAIILYSPIPACAGVWDFVTQVTGFVPGFFSEYIYTKCYKN
uniref:uncharacterized protein n=1 Tax=Lonchura striata TaxID=40157 RepID=UPI000B4C7C5F|nr:uncharacterized protein LOC110479540 [Lonchura striata domestica]